MLLPVVAAAQTGSIAGVVKDTTGAVLPGVAVEASSPALIERTRTAITDDKGQYKIVDLRPGLYTVTFTLAGFNIIKREGIELTTGFTAPVNADMKVGALEETVTVTGESPVVDTQRVTQQKVMTRDIIDAVPTGKNFQNIGVTLNIQTEAGQPADAVFVVADPDLTNLSDVSGSGQLGPMSSGRACSNLNPASSSAHSISTGMPMMSSTRCSNAASVSACARLRHGSEASARGIGRVP